MRLWHCKTMGRDAYTTNCCGLIKD